MNTGFLTIFLPEDEYKKEKILTYMAESTFLLIISHTILLILHKLNLFSFNNSVLLFLSIMFPILYTLVRYTISGIEYTSVFTKNDYQKTRKKIIFSSIKFTVLFFVLWIILIDLPNYNYGWFNLAGMAIFIFLFFNLFNIISLKISFIKNQKIHNE